MPNLEFVNFNCTLSQVTRVSKESKMNRRMILATILSFTALSVFAANKVYRYRCPKCKLIQEYEIPGSKKCPNDGHTMIRTN